MVLRKVRFHTVKDELFESKIYLLVNQLFIKLSAEAVLSSFFFSVLFGPLRANGCRLLDRSLGYFVGWNERCLSFFLYLCKRCAFAAQHNDEPN